MKRDPVLFQNTLQGFRFWGHEVSEEGWTSPHKRHYGATLKYANSLRYLKMIHPRWADLDDQSLYDGMKRVLWFADVIDALRRRDSRFPFCVSKIVSHNIFCDSSVELPPVIYMEFVKNELGPICPDLPETDKVSAEFIELCETMTDCHHAMQRITPAFLRETGHSQLLPSFLPHEMLGFIRNKMLVELLKRASFASPLWRYLLNRHELRARAGVLMNPGDYVLDTGAFEPANFFRSDVAQTEIIDTEFAGWTRPHAALAKAYVRLWANEQRPDLARILLFTYVEKFVQTQADYHVRSFFETFGRELLLRIKSGNFYDTFRRRHFSRSFPSHILRRALKRIVLKENYMALLP